LLSLRFFSFQSISLLPLDSLGHWMRLCTIGRLTGFLT